MNGHPLELYSLNQRQINWLSAQGIAASALTHPTSIMSATGTRHEDERFDPDPEGQAWIAFEEQDDLVFWQPRTGEFATDEGRAFSLGEGWIDNPAATALDGHLSIFADPLEWLRHHRRALSFWIGA